MCKTLTVRSAEACGENCDLGLTRTGGPGGPLLDAEIIWAVEDGGDGEWEGNGGHSSRGSWGQGAREGEKEEGEGLYRAAAYSSSTISRPEYRQSPVRVFRAGPLGSGYGTSQWLGYGISDRIPMSVS